MDDRRERQRRLDRARVLGHVELAVAFAAPLFAGFLYLAAPGSIGPMFYRPPVYEVLVQWAGVVGIVVGIAWMIRIHRANPDAGERTWRYRDF